MAKEFGVNSQNNQFYQGDLDLHLMALTLKLGLDMVKMPMVRHSNVIAQT